MLRTRPARLRLEAARSLGQLGLDVRAALPALVDALRGEDKALHRAAAEALAQGGTEAMPMLTRLLGNADGRLREGGARALGKIGVPARSSIEGLMRLVKDSDSAVRSQVALALWRIDQKADVALPILKQLIRDVDNRDRWESIEAMGIISIEAQPSIRGLTEIVVTALKDRDALVRTHAAKWLFRREKQPRVVVPLLRDGVTDRDVSVRVASVEVLGELGAEARVVPLLATALEDRDVLVRLVAEEALAQGGAEAVPQLIDALKNKNSRVRLGVARALGLMGPVAKGAKAALEGLEGDGNAAVSKAARAALWEIGARKSG
jgi:HEAT repeat protein